MKTFSESVKIKNNLALLEQLLIQLSKNNICPEKFIEWIVLEQDCNLNEGWGDFVFNMFRQSSSSNNQIGTVEKALKDLNGYSRVHSYRVQKLLGDANFGATIVGLINSLRSLQTSHYNPNISGQHSSINENITSKFLDWYIEEGYNLEDDLFTEGLWDNFTGWLGKKTGYTNWANKEDLQATNNLIQSLQALQNNQSANLSNDAKMYLGAAIGKLQQALEFFQKQTGQQPSQKSVTDQLIDIYQSDDFNSASNSINAPLKKLATQLVADALKKGKYQDLAKLPSYIDLSRLGYSNLDSNDYNTVARILQIQQYSSFDLNAKNKIKPEVQSLKNKHFNFNPELYGIKTDFFEQFLRKNDDKEFFESILGKNKKANWFAY